jgi:N-glycosylase/DNA lyase
LTHEQIVSAYETYLAENTKFTEKGVKASAARARKALGELTKLCKTRRAEIQASKTADSANA